MTLFKYEKTGRVGVLKGQGIIQMNKKKLVSIIQKSESC